jgi:MFS family permease
MGFSIGGHEAIGAGYLPNMADTRRQDNDSQRGVERAFLGFVVICAVAVAIGIVLIVLGHGGWGVPTVIVFAGIPLLTVIAARRAGRSIHWTWRTSRSKRPADETPSTGQGLT